jgi:hypothetical protein
LPWLTHLTENKLINPGLLGQKRPNSRFSAAKSLIKRMASKYQQDPQTQVFPLEKSQFKLMIGRLFLANSFVFFSLR